MSPAEIGPGTRRGRTSDLIENRIEKRTQPMVRARLAAVVVAALLALALGAAVAPTALAAADADPLVLAVEEDPEAEDRPPPGPDPVFEDNPFLPPEYDVPWTYGLGLILTAVGVLAIIATALGYWLLVRDDEPSRS